MTASINYLLANRCCLLCARKEVFEGLGLKNGPIIMELRYAKVLWPVVKKWNRRAESEGGDV